MTKTDYKNRKYTIESYNPEWKERFESEAKILRPIFSDKAILIEHVGSTAIPELAGKPTIDILITVPKIAVVDKLSKKIENNGYRALGDYINKGSRLFVKEENDTRLVNLHVFAEDHPHVKDMIHLRNYFRSHPQIVKEYSDLKFDLAKKYPNEYGQYRKYKDEWMERLKESIQTVSFVKEENIRNKIKTLFTSEKEKLQKLLPYSKIEHVGGTSITDSITKGDLDINIRVSKNDFQNSIEMLKKIYEINQPKNWTKSYASFTDDNRDLGIQLTVIDSADDCFVKQRDYLNANPEKVSELNKLKLSFEGQYMVDYRKKKGKFFENLKF